MVIVIDSIMATDYYMVTSNDWRIVRENLVQLHCENVSWEQASDKITLVLWIFKSKNKRSELVLQLVSNPQPLGCESITLSTAPPVHFSLLLSNRSIHPSNHMMQPSGHNMYPSHHKGIQLSAFATKEYSFIWLLIHKL